MGPYFTDAGFVGFVVQIHVTGFMSVYEIIYTSEMKNYLNEFGMVNSNGNT